MFVNFLIFDRIAAMKKESLFFNRMLKKIAPQIGASVLIEPKWKMTGRITFKNGKHSYFRYNTFDINPTGSSEIAKDKNYANFFMKKLGYKTVPKSRAFFSKQWGKTVGAPFRNIDAAYLYAKKIKFPVIIKPNSGRQGIGVSLAYNKQTFYTAMRSALDYDKIILVQKPVYGNDYRIIVFNKKVVLAYKRIPLSVLGDGKSSINQLNKIDDPRIARKLKRQGLTLRSILKKGEKVYLLDNANLSSGGSAFDATQKIHPIFKKLAVNLACDMGLRLCGIDIVVKGDISKKPDIYWVLEINASPGFNYYAKTGKEQRKAVNNLYLEILKYLEYQV